VKPKKMFGVFRFAAQGGTVPPCAQRCRISMCRRVLITTAFGEEQVSPWIENDASHHGAVDAFAARRALTCSPFWLI
jgi:hypothetical protein